MTVRYSSALLNKKAADLLLQAGVLKASDHERVMSYVQRMPMRAEDAIVDMGILSEQDLLKALAAHYKTKFVTAERLSRSGVSPALLELVPRRVAETLNIVPLLHDPASGTLLVATPDPDNLETLNEVQLVSGVRDVKAIVARPAAVKAAILRAYTGDARAFGALERGSDPGVVREADTRGSGSGGSSVFTVEPVTNAYQRTIAPTGPARPSVYATEGPSDIDIVHRPLRKEWRRDEVTTMSPATGAMATIAPAPALPKIPPPHIPPGPASVAPPSAGPLSEPPIDPMSELLNVMVNLLENTREGLRGHSAQVARLVRRLIDRLNLPRTAMNACMRAAFVHDLGKMGELHLTALNVFQFESHRAAAFKAYDIPVRLLEAVQLGKETTDAVLHMYERYDGKGFPDSLAGKDIPMGSRLLALADTYADLTQNAGNPFGKVLTAAEAFGVLEKHKATLFDPHLVELFAAVMTGFDLRARLLDERYTALIVDPNPEETTVLELRMIEQGFQVKIARSATEAAKVLSLGDIDLVVSELDLPRGDGLALLADARKNAWGKDVPWVIHTRRQGRADAQKAFELGVLDFASKVAPTDVLVAKLKAMLDQRAAAGKEARGVSGSLAEMSIPDMVQILWQGRKSGALKIHRGGDQGEIHFADGAVVNASWGKLRGENAFYAMLTLKEGDFALDPTFRTTSRVIQQSSEALLLEGMRRMDEGVTN